MPYVAHPRSIVCRLLIEAERGGPHEVTHMLYAEQSLGGMLGGGCWKLDGLTFEGLSTCHAPQARGPRQRGGQVSMEPRQKIETTHLGPVQSMNHMLLILKLGTLDTRVARRSAVQTPERSASLVFDCCMHATAL